MKLLPFSMTLLLASTLVFADDGAQFSRDVSKTPDWDTEHTSLRQLFLYVPATSSSGESTTIEYFDPEGTLLGTRDQARPLIAFYEDGPVEPTSEEDGGFYGHGERDMYAAVSFDDGTTWKRTNLSRSADKSSISIQVPFKKKTRAVPYPGDVFRNFTTAAGNRTLAVWASRYCNGGNANYTLETEERDALGVYLGIASDDLYLNDIWGVAGSQKIKDFAEEDYPSVGQVPYACLWAARGTLELDADTGLPEIVWRQAERLTSGVRDAHRMETACVPGVGCVITWQEDPEGLRPGKGEGPGEGWSGAIAHHETDIWYSYISWSHFDLVAGETGPVPLDEYVEDEAPKAGIPFSMPMRLTDNAMCKAGIDEETPGYHAYCYADFDGNSTSDNCADSVAITTDGGSTIDMCVTEDGRLLRGNTASTRARTHLRGLDSDGDQVFDKAFVIMGYEESKGLGEEDDDAGDKYDMGKNIWYHTFEMFDPELVSQGMLLNPPAIYPDNYDINTISGGLDGVTLNADSTAGTFVTGGNFATFESDPVWLDLVPENHLYQMEISRRYSQITQAAKVFFDEDGGRIEGMSGTVAFTMWKQGIVRQGGPADVYARRFVLPVDFDPSSDNPYDYDNMVCDFAGDGMDYMRFIDGSNPRYVKGLCVSTPINISATTVVDCVDGIDNCTVEDFPFDELFADIAGAGTSEEAGDGDIAKTIEWRQCGPGIEFEGCLENNLDDPSWQNPYDVAKGHRGFMKGDHIMAMYAWSPNWKANADGKDNYNLYVRRSFDGGQTWTALPAGYAPEGVLVEADGAEHCEDYGLPGEEYDEPTCTTYAAGDFEQARNLSRLTGHQLTVLDPRFAATPAPIAEPQYDDEDVTNPSRFFATFEVGDTAGIVAGREAEPMDMFYSRAVNYGDDYDLADLDEDGITDYFDMLECSEAHAAEASLTANPSGTWFYSIWNQWEEEDGYIYESDAIVRRTMELDDPPYITLRSGGCGSDGGGGGGGGGKGKPK